MPPSVLSVTTHHALRGANSPFPSGPPHGGWTPRRPPPRSQLPQEPHNRVSVPPSGAPPAGSPPSDESSAVGGLEDLKAHATAAVAIEFTTIPMYLYATWSIMLDNGGPGTKARYALLGVVQQEMLHLSLSGNILRALGGEYRLYDETHMPVYDDDAHILYDEVQLNLEPAEKHLLGTFVKIESPYEAPKNQVYKDAMNLAMGKPVSQNIAPQYHSIGEFYKEFGDGLRKVAKDDPTVLSNNPKMQFGPDDFFGPDMVVIRDLDTALQAMTTIVDQGEGAVGVDDSHYRVFLDLYEKRDTWDCYPVARNPRTSDYKGHDYLYRLSRALDASYCYLLRIIDDIWYDDEVASDANLRHWLIRCMHPLMMDIFPPLAGVIVGVPFKDGRTAGPCFNFYPEGDPPMTREKLQKSILSELDLALATAEGQAGGMKAKLQAIRFSVEKVGPNPIVPPS